jgi:hypothetical protein
LHITVGSPAELTADELLTEGRSVLALSAACRCRHRPAVQARGLRLLALSSHRAGERIQEDRDQLPALAIATRNSVRNLRDDYRRLVQQSERALSRLEDDELDLVPRLRLAVRQLLVERETLANLLTAPPRLRQEAGRLRVASEDTYPEVGSSEDEASDGEP